MMNPNRGTCVTAARRTGDWVWMCLNVAAKSITWEYRCTYHPTTAATTMDIVVISRWGPIGCVCLWMRVRKMIAAMRVTQKRMLVNTALRIAGIFLWNVMCDAL